MIIHGDCLAVLPTLDDNSVDAIVTDPPYELGFMNKGWDASGIAYNVDLWRECLRVLKPGGHLLSFGGSRTYHRMACAIEDAGFEIRDQIQYIYGSGFPKSQNIEKVLIKKLEECENAGDEEWANSQEIPEYELRLVRGTDISQEVPDGQAVGEVLQQGVPEQALSEQRETGAKPEVADGEQPGMEGRRYIQTTERELRKCKICEMSAPVFTDGAKRWLCHGTPFGYGTASWQTTPADRSCPSYRSQSEKQQNRKSDDVQEQRGTQEIRRAIETYKGFGSALKPSHEPICMARKPLSEKTIAANILKWGTGGLNIDGCRVGTEENLTRDCNGFVSSVSYDHQGYGDGAVRAVYGSTTGRFPANLIHDGSDEVVQGFPSPHGAGSPKPSGGHNRMDNKSIFNNSKGGIGQGDFGGARFGDSGSAARFFYCAKASKAERNMGCEGLDAVIKNDGRGQELASGDVPMNRSNNAKKNHHPTVKPLALMRYLCRLITPPDGTVLDPFAGSGSTLIAAKQEGFNYIGIELEEEYIEIAKCRLSAVEERQPSLFGG